MKGQHNRYVVNQLERFLFLRSYKIGNLLNFLLRHMPPQSSNYMFSVIKSLEKILLLILSSYTKLIPNSLPGINHLPFPSSNICTAFAFTRDRTLTIPYISLPCSSFTTGSKPEVVLGVLIALAVDVLRNAF